MEEEDKKIIVFRNRNIRRTWHNNEWFFSISDIIEILSESTNIKQYIKKMRQRDSGLKGNWGTICTPPLNLLEKMAKKE